MEKSPESLDYSPLNVKLPVAKKSQLTNIPRFNNFAGAIILTIFTLPIQLLAGIGIFITAPLTFLILWKVIGLSGYSAIRLSNFAVANNLHYSWKKKGTVSLKGVLGDRANGLRASNLISGHYVDFSFQLFNPYTKTRYTVMQINLRNKYPHIVLDNLRNNSVLAGSITKYFEEGDSVELEGDFGKYFKVYTKADPVDSLRVLSPDVMALMVDFSHDYDIEIIEDRLNIVGNYKFSDEQGVREFFAIADKLMDKLDRRNATVHAEFDSTKQMS